MRRYKNTHNTFGTIWQAITRNYSIRLVLTEDVGYQWDGDLGPDDDTQDRLDDGTYVAFDSDVIVELDGVEIARASLGGSVYEPHKTHEFMTDVYFKDMLAEACAAARTWTANRPTLRKPT